MRTVTDTLYSAAELRDLNEQAFDRAHQRYVRSVYNDPAWAGEYRDSLRALVDAFGSEPPQFDLATRKEDSRRSMAWVENHILEPLRQPWLPLSHPKRRNTSRYGSAYRPGPVNPCPFTGFCVDDALLDYVAKEARSGTSPKNILRRLPGELERLWSDELEWQCTAEAFLEASDANGWEYRANGSTA